MVRNLRHGRENKISDTGVVVCQPIEMAMELVSGKEGKDQEHEVLGLSVASKKSDPGNPYKPSG
jgi:hypothetical protein